MKKAAAFILSVALTACSIDAYDKGEGEYSLLTAEMADVTIGSDKYTKAIETDQGEKLTLAKPVTVKWMEKGDTTYRALVYYKQQADGKAEMVSMSRVGVLKPRRLTSEDGREEVMKTDPLYVESVWTGKNKKYVNMRLRLLTGEASPDPSDGGEKAVQTLGLIDCSPSSEGQRAAFVLYHDQGGQPEYYSTTAFVSIPLNEVPADTLTITVNTYDGVFTRTIAN